VALKKPLELEPTPLEGDDSADSGGAKSRYETHDRRIELTTVSGKTHREFSHETGTVQVDDAGLEEFRKKHEAETAERAQRTREFHAKEAEKLRKVFTNNSLGGQLDEQTEGLQYLGRIVLVGSVLYFGFRGVVELGGLAAGHAAPQAMMYIVMAAVAAIVFALPFLPLKLAKAFARLGYALTLIYLGALGTMHLFDLWRHPPPARYHWDGFATHALRVGLVVASMIGVFLFARFVWRLRPRIMEAFKTPDAPLLQEYPVLRNRANLRALLYCLEGAVIASVFVTISLVCMSDPLLFATMIARNPVILLGYLYPAGVYVFFRSIYFPKT
jgi:hypothetical protein